MSSARIFATALLVLAATGCKRSTDVAPATPVAAGPDATYVQQTWPLPSTIGAGQPDLVATDDGRVLLSWISNTPGRRTALQFVSLADDGHWQSPPRTIAVGDSFFVNWADTPHIATTDDGALWVHWLQKSADATHAYDVMLSHSRDGGVNWSAPVPVNDDGKPVEHGFASLWPQSRDSLGVAWLDGRNTGPTAEATGGMMSLRAATFSAALQRVDDVEIDASACDCCQTTAVMTERGPLLVYRDRTADEIRDIYATRRDGNAWSPPKPVHADGWKMPACPVNGPAVAANGNDVVVAWYTAAGPSTGSGQATPMVKLARSGDAGDSFSAPLTLDQGQAVQGRVDIAMDAQQAWVLWMREDTQGQSLWLARYPTDLSRELQRTQVASLQGRGRGTGFPQLALHDGNAYLVWTDVVDGVPQLHGAIFAAK